MTDKPAQERQDQQREAAIQQKTWDIWEYVREHRHSLDSERGCKMIQEGFDLAVSETQRALEDCQARNSHLRAELRGVKKQLKLLKDRVEMPWSDQVLMPRELTADNGAKAELIGEFFEEFDVLNPDYCGCGVCHYCLDPPQPNPPETETIAVEVSWTTIKRIYDRVVRLFAPDEAKEPCPPQPQTSTPSVPDLKALTSSQQT